MQNNRDATSTGEIRGVGPAARVVGLLQISHEEASRTGRWRPVQVVGEEIPSMLYCCRS
jgi:hypothetical protein